MERISACLERDRVTSTSLYWTVKTDDTDAWSERWKAVLAKSNDCTLDLFTRDQGSNAKSVIGTSASTEDIDMVPYATLSKALADKDAMEDSIRREADPGGIYGRGTIDTAGLVKNIRKRHRDCIEENRRQENAMRIEKEDMQQNFDDEKKRLCRIIRGQKEVMQSRFEQGQQIRDDYGDLQIKYQEVLGDNKVKDNRITELQEKVEAVIDTCKRVTEGSVKSLKFADRQMERRMEHRISCIKTTHGQELAEIRGWNVTLQERLKIARRLQPVYIFHRAEVGTVCEMHEKLVQMKKAKKEELAAKEKENEDLRSSNGYQEREICELKMVAETDEKKHNETENVLREKRKALSAAEQKARRHQREVEALNQHAKVWETAYHAKDDELIALKSKMNILKADQRMELIRAQAENESLQIRIGYCEEANDRMQKELESWENGHGGILEFSKPKQNYKQRDDSTESLAKALKAANARADALQISVTALQAERGVWERQLADAAAAYNPQVQEQMADLESENRKLREAAGKPTTLENQLRAQFAEAERNLEERFANKARELEAGFDRGFESLRQLRDQWLLEKRALEEQHYRKTVAENLRHEIERQGREEQIMAGLQRRREELQNKENDLQSREAELAMQVRDLHSRGQNLITMTARAEKAEAEVSELQVAALRDLHSRGQNLITMTTRAEKAEAEVSELQVAALNNTTYWTLNQHNLDNEIQNQRRDGQRHLDLLNEETGKMADGSRLQDLHNDLQTANCSMNSFKYHVTQPGTNNEGLSQGLYGADFYESDVRLLQLERRPVLLAQLQAAKRTLESLRNLLTQSPNVEVDKALSIVMAPRGDEDAAQPADDIVDLFSAPQQNPRKRSAAPLGSPTYGDHEDNVASDDWGVQDQGVSSGAALSKPEEISNRQRLLPKSRRNGGPANSVFRESIDPAIRDQ
ncbi:MAG: hypothetical protein ASARMPRED_009301 [Alectoria sarmentosa]|nr:MAG: hypothetical protein ASARMPRED_009301 [Alectoria sarmentosa]